MGSLWALAFSSVNGSRISTLLVTGRVSWDMGVSPGTAPAAMVL